MVLSNFLMCLQLKMKGFIQVRDSLVQKGLANWCYHRIIEYLGFEGTSRIIKFQAPNHRTIEYSRDIVTHESHSAISPPSAPLLWAHETQGPQALMCLAFWTFHHLCSPPLYTLIVLCPCLVMPRTACNAWGEAAPMWSRARVAASSLRTVLYQAILT